MPFAMLLSVQCVAGPGEASDLLAAGAKFGNDFVNTLLVNGTQTGVGNAQADPAVLGLAPEPAVLQVGAETALGVVVGVGNVISHHRCFTGHLAEARHTMHQRIRSAKSPGEYSIRAGWRKSTMHKVESGARRAWVARLQQSAFGKRQRRGVRGDDEMIEHAHIDQGESLLEI